MRREYVEIRKKMIKKKPKIKKPVKDIHDDIILPEVVHDRSNVHYNGMDNFSFSEDHTYKPNPVASKFSGDLFHEETAAKAHPVVRVKYISSATNERWRIYEDAKNTFTIEGKRLSKKEREFLHTTEGAQFLLAHSKGKDLSVSLLKKEMRPRINLLSRSPKK